MFLFWHSKQFMYTACSELVVFLYRTGKSMNNHLSCCGLVDTRISVSEKDLLVSWAKLILLIFDSPQPIILFLLIFLAFDHFVFTNFMLCVIKKKQFCCCYQQCGCFRTRRSRRVAFTFQVYSLLSIKCNYSIKCPVWIFF